MSNIDRKTLTARFKAAWNPTVPALYDNQPNVTMPTTAYVHFSVRQGDSQHYAGDRFTGSKLQLGRVWIQVFVPAQTSTGLADSLLDAFCAIFENWNSDDYAIEVATRDDNAPAMQPNGMMMFSTSIPWKSIRDY